MPVAVYIRFHDETIESNTKEAVDLIATSPVSEALQATKDCGSVETENAFVNNS